MPGSSTASTWSPGRITVESSASSERPLRMTEISRVLRQPQVGHALARCGRVALDLELDDLEVLLAQLEQVHDPVLGHLLLDRPSTFEVAQTVRLIRAGRSAPGCGSFTRAITFGTRCPRSRAADDQVVLVVARDGEHELGRRAIRRARARAARSRHRAAPGARTLPGAGRSGRGAARSASPRGPSRAASGRRWRPPCHRSATTAYIRRSPRARLLADGGARRRDRGLGRADRARRRRARLKSARAGSSTRMTTHGTPALLHDLADDQFGVVAARRDDDRVRVGTPALRRISASIRGRRRSRPPSGSRACERLLLLVDRGHVPAVLGEVARDRGADPAAPDHHEVHPVRVRLPARPAGRRRRAPRRAPSGARSRPWARRTRTGGASAATSPRRSGRSRARPPAP